MVDAVIIGGGPAGLATGIALKKRGIDALVVDAACPPIDKACGEGFMPDALQSLASLGVQVEPYHGGVFAGIRFLDDKHTVEAPFPHGLGIGVRRTTFHDLLLNQAKRVGLATQWNARVRLIDDRSIQINDSTVNFRWLVGADGQNSALRKWAGLDDTKKFICRYGFRKHFQVAPWSPFVEVYWGKRGQIYVTPVGLNEVGMALVTRDPQLRLDDVLSEFPHLQARVKGASTTSTERGSLTTTRTLKCVTRGSIALVGDASGSVDAVTGEGIAMSFRQANALAEAISCYDLKMYEQAHHEIGRLPSMMSSLMLTMDKHPWLRRRVLAALSSKPKSFSQMLSVHIGHQKIWKFALKEAPSFGINLLTTSLLTIFLLAFSLFAPPASSAADEFWNIDPVHSKAMFKVKHLMISDVKGQFKKVSGTVKFDGKDLAAASVDATIESGSIDTGIGARDEHLRAPDVFDVVHFPGISYKSAKVIPCADGTFNIDGTLTMHGISREVQLRAKPLTPSKDDPSELTTTATAELNRKDFGVTVDKPIDHGGAVIGETVNVTLVISLAKAVR